MIVPDRRRIAHTFIVRYPWSQSGQTMWWVSSLRDFSRTGARFLSEQPVRVGEDVNLQLLLPIAREPVWIRARVVSSKPIARHVFDVEVKFQSGPVDAQHAINDAAALLERYVQGAGQERRRFQRIAQPFTAQCRLSGTLGDIWHQIAIRDLSAGGMRFESDTTLEPDALVEFKLQLPNVAEATLLKGRLLRMTMRGTNLIEHAVEFVDVNPDQAAQLDALVHFLEKHS